MKNEERRIYDVEIITDFQLEEFGGGLSDLELTMCEACAACCKYAAGGGTISIEKEKEK